MQNRLSSRKNCSFIAILLLDCLLIGCVSVSSSHDPKSDWLNKIPCAAPCWENIIPGTTTNEEAFKIIKTSSWADSFATQDSDLITIASWRFKVGSWQGKIPFIPTEISQPISEVTLITPDLCLGEIISNYGEPDLLFLPNYKAVGEVDLIWKSSGFAYATKLDSVNRPITENTCGGGIVHFPLNTPITKIPGINAEFSSESEFVPWKGYDKY